MKTYTVSFLDEQGFEVLAHRIFAKNKKDAEKKSQACVESHQVKSVVSYVLSEIKKETAQVNKEEGVSKQGRYRKNKQYTLESWMICNGKEGDVFYSEKTDRHLTAFATHHSRKISTERILAVTTAKSTPECRYIVRVTLL
jgi:hypothetical protein